VISQNGWPVIDRDDLAPLVVRGVSVAPGVRRSLLPLFADLAERLADIEPPAEGWCWGWAFRPIRGQTSGFSNHASGTAIDWNAPKHPRGDTRHAGWSAGQVTAIHRLLTRYDGVVRWGGDYRLPPFDAMHFEVNDDPSAVARVMQRLPQQEVDDVSKQDVIDALADPLAVTRLRKAVWGGTGAEIPSIFGTTNAAQVVEVAARGVQTLASRLNEVNAGLADDHAAILAAVAAIPTAHLELDDEDLAGIAEQVDLDPEEFIAAWRADLLARPLIVTPTTPAPIPEPEPSTSV
jgi:hypothetical protein